MPETSLTLRGPSALLVGGFPGLTLHGAGEERDRASYMADQPHGFVCPLSALLLDPGNSLSCFPKWSLTQLCVLATCTAIL